LADSYDVYLEKKNFYQDDLQVLKELLLMLEFISDECGLEANYNTFNENIKTILDKMVKEIKQKIKKGDEMHDTYYQALENISEDLGLR
jgi:predicted ATP-dependent protease